MKWTKISDDRVFKKIPKIILEVLTLRLLWGLKSLNFKTFKTLVFDLVLKVLTLRLVLKKLQITKSVRSNFLTKKSGLILNFCQLKLTKISDDIL